MNLVEVLAALAADGVEMALRNGKLCLRPPRRASRVLVACIAENASALRELLSTSGDNHAPETRDDLDAAREAAEERAAILEYDAGYSRQNAEHVAGLASLGEEAPSAGAVACDDRSRRRRAPAPE